MSEIGTGKWAQAFGFLGVIVSLLFVAYELKQSRDIALAEIYQQKTAMTMAVNTGLINSPALLDAYVTSWTSPETLEIKDLILIHGDLGRQFSYFENNHYQYQLGMIDEEQMDTIRAMITGIFQDNLARDFWIRTSATGAWRKTFKAEVDTILAGLDPAEPWSASAQADSLARARCVASYQCPPGQK